MQVYIYIYMRGWFLDLHRKQKSTIKGMQKLLAKAIQSFD